MTETIAGQTTGCRRVLPSAERWADLGFAAVLLALLWVVYAPSLDHTPRADQWYFLVDTVDQHNFLDIFARSYSYNRTRLVMPGDTDLYRPLLFAVLAAEKALFDDNFTGYQAVGILLHWGVACLLLLLLRTLLLFTANTVSSAPSPSPSWASWLLPYGVCLFFALNKSVQELVIWTHLHGYLVFLMLMLASMTLLLRYVRRSVTWASPLLWGSWSLALLSAFTYEMGQFYAVLAGLFLALVLPRGTGMRQRVAFAGLFAAVLVLYQGANRWDRKIHQGKFHPEGVRTAMMERAFSKETVDHTKRFLAYTVARPYFPSLWTGRFLDCGRILLDEATWSRDQFEQSPPMFIASILTAAVASSLGLFGLVRLLLRGDKRSVLVFLFPLALYGVYLAMIVLGRLNLRPGPHCLSFNSYYGHIGLLLALVPSFALWQATGRSRAVEAVQAALLVGMLALTGYGAPDVRRLNESVARDLKGCRETVAALRDFVARHKDERDFSIAIDLKASDLVRSACLLPIPVCSGCPIIVPPIVFKRWLRPNAKYIVTLRGGQVHVRAGGPLDVERRVWLRQ